MKNTAILEVKKEEKNVLRMRLEYTHTGYRYIFL